MRPSLAESIPERWSRRLLRDGIGLGLAIGLLGVWLAWSAPSAGESSAGPAASVTCGSYRLDLQIGDFMWKSGEPIEGEARLTYLGEGVGRWSGSGSGPIGFQYLQIGGDLRVQPASRLNLEAHELAAGTPLVVPLSKSGGWSDDDPHADFYRSFFSGDGVRLVAGTWEIAAVTDGACDGLRNPSTSARVRIQVVP